MAKINYTMEDYMEETNYVANVESDCCEKATSIVDAIVDCEVRIKALCRKFYEKQDMATAEELDDAVAYYSDLYKDEYGIRPMGEIVTRYMGPSIVAKYYNCL